MVCNSEAAFVVWLRFGKGRKPGQEARKRSTARARVDPDSPMLTILARTVACPASSSHAATRPPARMSSSSAPQVPSIGGMSVDEFKRNGAPDALSAGFFPFAIPCVGSHVVSPCQNNRLLAQATL